MTYIVLQRQVTALANAEIQRHNLVGWRFRFNTNKRRGGVCKYDIRTIEVSIHMLQFGLKEVVKVIAHELAHAIVGCGHGHDFIWKRKAIELGDTGNRCHTFTLVAPSIIGTCSHCGGTFGRHRAPRRGATYWCNRPSCAHLPTTERLVTWEHG